MHIYDLLLLAIVVNVISSSHCFKKKKSFSICWRVKQLNHIHFLKTKALQVKYILECCITTYEVIQDLLLKTKI